jgi:hypothetical protein
VTTNFDRCKARATRAVGVVTIIGGAALVAACGPTTPSVSVPTPNFTSGAVGAPTASPSLGPTSGQLGDTLTMEDVGEDIAHVTMLKVFDPPTGVDPNAQPPDGTRWVGFEGTIVIDGVRSGQDSISVEVIGSDGQTYGSPTGYHLSVFDGCTATDGNGLPPGQTQTFCAGVGLPPGITVAKIGYSTEGVDGGAPAKLFWTVSSDSGAAPTTPTADDSSSTPTAAPAAATTGSVGDTLTYVDTAGESTQVQLVQVYDPAPNVAPDDTPPTGTHWVGFKAVITGSGASDDAHTLEVIGSDGQTYGFNTSYHLTGFDGCLTTAGSVADGQPYTFCAGVGLPPGVTVTKVGYSLEGVDVGMAPELFWTAS